VNNSDVDPARLVRRVRGGDGLALRAVGDALVALYALPRSGEVVIGSGRDADVRIDDASIARRHALLSLGTRTRIKDLGAGTRVADRALEAGEWIDLWPGDVIDVGQVMLIAMRGEAPVVHGGDAMARAERLLERVAPTDLGVVIEGETGVGKEVFAERLHARSRRAAGPFLRTNCRGAAPALLERELGDLIARAAGGSLFLDQIGELPTGLQARLLGALRDVRVITATDRDLHAEVAAGRFRRDLHYQLNGVTLHVPPLRERAAEIGKLARAFLARTGRGLTPEAIARLEQHRWPGNIRELKNVLDSAALIAPTDVVDAEHLSLRPAPAEPAAPGVDEQERQRIVAALEACGGNQTRAAHTLGISRGTLLARIKLYGIKRPRS
jgi:two-component system response regulator AtoC